MAPQQNPVRTVMGYVSWIGLVACSIAGLGYLLAGAFNLAGLMIALAVLSWINIQRKRKSRRVDPRKPG